MRNTINMSAYALSLSGIDPMLHEPEVLVDAQPRSSYPQYAVQNSGEDRWHVVLVVPGFARQHLSVTVERQQLTISGEKPAGEERTVGSIGLSNPSFSRCFYLADHLTAKSAELSNGLLIVRLEKQEQSPAERRQIPIAGQSEIAIFSKHAA